MGTGHLIDQRGAGLVGTFAGVLVFIVFLLFAVQLLFNLYATSAVTAAALDAARVVAAERVDHTNAGSVQEAQQQADARARRILGRYGSRAQLSWTMDDEVVRVHVQVRNPRVFFAGLDRAIGFDSIDRTVAVRIEKYR